MLPVVVSNFCQALDHIIISHLDCQLSAGIKAARRQVDRSNDRADIVTEQHLGMKFEVFQLVNLDADILHHAHPSHGLNELFLLELVRWARHHVNLHSAARSPDQPLDDNCILVALILKKNGILRLVNKLGDALPTVTAAPDQMRVFVPEKFLRFQSASKHSMISATS